jgi:predicted neuraminidase
MKTSIWLGLISIMFFSSLPGSQKADPELVHSELIYPLDHKPTPQCHASTIVETSSGNLLAAWFGGTHEKNPDVGIWLSRRENGKWLEPIEIVNGEWTLGRRFPCWNPVLFQPRNGPLMLFYKVGPSPSTWWGEMMISDDNGLTWKDRKHLPLGGIGPVKNKPIQLEDGTILCPSSSEHDNWKVHFEITRDLGKTWEIVGPIHDGRQLPSIQPSILVHPNQTLQILCRSTKGVITESWSTDNGRTWGPVRETTLPNPSAGTDAVTLRDGRHLLVYNPLKKGRNVLSVAVSGDGKNWKEFIKLEEEDAGEFSYPAVIQASDGLIHITYTYLRQSIKHVILNPR